MDIEAPMPGSLTEKTVFDHIRKKAKNFPALPTLVYAKSDPSGIFIPTRPATRGDHDNDVQQESAIAIDLDPESQPSSMANWNLSRGTSEAVSRSENIEMSFHRTSPRSDLKLHEQPSRSMRISDIEPMFIDGGRVAFNESPQSRMRIENDQATRGTPVSRKWMGEANNEISISGFIVSNPSSPSNKSNSKVSELKRSLSPIKKRLKTDSGTVYEKSDAGMERTDITKAIMGSIFKPEKVQTRGCSRVMNPVTEGANGDDIFGRFKSVFSFLY